MMQYTGNRMRLPMPPQCPTCRSVDTVHEIPAHPGQFYCDKCQQPLFARNFSQPPRIMKAMGA